MAAPLLRRLVRATRGNPLAIEQLPAVLDAEQLTGVEPLVEPLPVGAAVGKAFRRRLAGLPRATERALLVAAASDSRDMGAIELERARRRSRISAAAIPTCGSSWPSRSPTPACRCY